MQSNRRVFVIQSILGTSTLATAYLALAQAPLVQETEPQAVALGYKNDATKADKVKYPKYAPGQQCSNCALYQGKPTDLTAACPLFAGKQVAAKAWCSAWTKKA